MGGAYGAVKHPEKDYPVDRPNKARLHQGQAKEWDAGRLIQEEVLCEAKGSGRLCCHRDGPGERSPRPSTTSLVTSGTEVFGVVGLDQPEDEIVKQPGEDLPMHRGKRPIC